MKNSAIKAVQTLPSFQQLGVTYLRSTASMARQLQKPAVLAEEEIMCPKHHPSFLQYLQVTRPRNVKMMKIIHGAMVSSVKTSHLAFVMT